MGTCDSSDMYAPSPLALDIYIRQIAPAHVTTYLQLFCTHSYMYMHACNMHASKKVVSRENWCALTGVYMVLKS